MGKYYLALHTLQGTTDKVEITSDLTTWTSLGTTTGYAHTNVTMGIIDKTCVIANVKQGASSAGPAYAIFNNGTVTAKYLGTKTQFLSSCGEEGSGFISKNSTTGYKVNTSTGTLTTISYSTTLQGTVYGVVDVSEPYGKPTVALCSVNSTTCYVYILDIATSVITRLQVSNWVNSLFVAANGPYLSLLGIDAAKSSRFVEIPLPHSRTSYTPSSATVSAQAWFTAANKDTAGTYFTLAVEKFNTGFCKYVGATNTHLEPGGIAKPYYIAPWDNGQFIVSSGQDLIKISLSDSGITPTVLFTVPTEKAIKGITSREFNDPTPSTGGTPENPYLIVEGMVRYAR